MYREARSCCQPSSVSAEGGEGGDGDAPAALSRAEGDDDDTDDAPAVALAACGTAATADDDAADATVECCADAGEGEGPDEGEEEDGEGRFVARATTPFGFRDDAETAAAAVDAAPLRFVALTRAEPAPAPALTPLAWADNSAVGGSIADGVFDESNDNKKRRKLFFLSSQGEKKRL